MTNLLHVGDGEACVGEEVPYEGSVRLGAGDFDFLGHPDEFGERVSAHLAHEAAAIDLSGRFHGPNFGGYLFIERPETSRGRTSRSRSVREARRVLGWRISACRCNLSRSRSRASWTASSRS